MPELPEVEFARQCLTRWLAGQKLAAVETSATRVLRGGSAKALEQLAGHQVKRIDRCGKWLLWELDRGLGLVAHLGMTGKFVLQERGEPEVKWSRATFVRRDGSRVHFQDARMFGRLKAGPIEELKKEEGYAALGPDAWDSPLSADALHERFQSTRRSVKDVLMDQTVLAGLGNIQVTEALWRAGLHPARLASKLSAAECRKLVQAIHWTLKRTIAMNKGDKIVYVEESSEEENPFLVYGKAGEPCPKCGTKLHKTKIGGRTTAFCPHCQPKQ